MHPPCRRRLRGLTLAVAVAIGTAHADPAPPATESVAIPIRPDVTVAADGSGEFANIQDALNSIPRSNRERRIIYIKNGTYLQKIRIDPACITLRGQSRTGTRIVYAQDADDFRRHPDALGIGVVNINGDDCVLQNLTVQNLQGAIGVHAFAIIGHADRTVITDCDVFSRGNDTLAPWRSDGGRYYFSGLDVRGASDFVCPRGWCYMADSRLFEVDPRAEAALWHDGSRDRGMKFVLRRCRFDGKEGWRLARHHFDAQFYLLDCTFSRGMRNLAPRRVIYPLDGQAPTREDIGRNMQLEATNVWGERDYYFNCHRQGGDYPWFADNLATAPEAPVPDRITAAWTFGGTWDPERTDDPKILRIDGRGRHIEVVFSEPVTVKGRPQLVLRSGETVAYASGSGSDTLTFAARDPKPEAVVRLALQGGAIIASEAGASLRAADLSLP